MSCSELSLAAREPLAGTATHAERWLLVEARGAWGRDVVADTALPDAVREALETFEGRVLLIRRPDRRHGVTVILADGTEEGGRARLHEIDSLHDMCGLDLGAGVPLTRPLVLVCTHGRRDACCARLGVPLYDALVAHLPSEALWQSSHLGGHRFAPNVLVLPSGVQLGRVPPSDAAGVAAAVLAGRVPLEHHRGRTLYAAPVQAAEVAARRAFGIDAIGGLRLLSYEGGVVRFAADGRSLSVRVDATAGPVVPASCGAEPEPTDAWSARVESTP